jgi:hypothetical protein
MPNSHALNLAIQLTCIEARHIHAEQLQPDHIILGLLKLVDVNLGDYLEKISDTEAHATKREIKALTDIFNAALVETTGVRRKLRYRLNPQGPSDKPSKGNPPPSAEYTDVIARTDNSHALPSISLLICALKSCSKSTVLQFKESGSTLEKLCDAAQGYVVQNNTGEEWIDFIHSVSKLNATWVNIPGANALSLSEVWRRLLSKGQVRIDTDGTLTVSRTKKIVLISPASIKNDWSKFYGPELSESLLQFYKEAIIKDGSVTIPVDEL